jgi:antitoxin (DNA-binding transcriptional repressor) of toxin-antitoxin stability system
MIKATIFEAKTSLSNLVKQAQEGTVVVITSGRKKTPVAQLVGIGASEKKRIGVLETPCFEISGKFFEPLPEEELQQWEGGEE